MIPRQLHFIWLQGADNLPDGHARLIDTWRATHPGYTVEIWDDERIRDELDLPYLDLYDKARRIVPRDAVHQFRSDLARWVILQRGGIYSDTDVRAQQDITPLLDAPMVTGWEIQDKWIGSSVIACEPGHPATHAVIEHIDHITRIAKPWTRPNRLTGPQAITPVLKGRPDVKVLPEPLWYPVRWDNPLAADEHHEGAYLVHAWAHQRALRGLRECGSQGQSKPAQAPTHA